MKREKTVIDVEVSEEKHREIVSSLLREHTNVGMKFERERTRQEEMVSPINLAPLCSTVSRVSLLVVGKKKAIAETRRENYSCSNSLKWNTTSDKILCLVLPFQGFLIKLNRRTKIFFVFSQSFVIHGRNGFCSCKFSCFFFFPISNLSFLFSCEPVKNGKRTKLNKSRKKWRLFWAWEKDRRHLWSNRRK